MKRLNELIEALVDIKHKGEMEDFLKGILTAKEFEEISTRLQIIKMLKKGVAQHQIAEKLKVGIATVTRGSKELSLGRFKNIN